MKKVIQFSKAFVPCVILSVALIASGIVGLFTRGLNYGIDFQAGYIEKVRLAPTALSLTYAGAQTVTVTQSSSEIDVIVTGVTDDNKTFKFPYASYPTVGDFAAAVTAVPGLAVQVNAPAGTALKSVFPDSGKLTRLGADPYRYHYVPEGAAIIDVKEIRSALEAKFPNASVQVVGKPQDRQFQIRLADDGKDPDASQTLRTGLATVFEAAYGVENVAVISTDFVGSMFSKTLASQAFWLSIVTLLLIGIYCAIRFRWDFAIGGILAIAHDALIMIAFIVWSGMEFNSNSIAAILTILGYSINDTVVIFDRIRENMRTNPNMKMVDILNLAQTEILGRTIITSSATMLAVLSLFIFTTGDMKNFALCLLVGMLSGVYSTIYIASAFIAFVDRFRKDKSKGRFVEKVKAVKLETSGEVI